MKSQISNFPVQILHKEDYPAVLTSIPNSPNAIFYRGKLPCFKNSWIAMVGTRRPSQQAEEICRRLIRNLVGTDAVIVSGLAQGVDCFCHLSAIEHHLPTVAVVAQGIESEIGGSRRNVAEKILQSGGAILSEYPKKTFSKKFMFHDRNRIIAGLCKSTTLVESKAHGGGMITANFATEFHRKLLCVPGSPIIETSLGTNLCIASRKAEAIWKLQDFADLCGAKRIKDPTLENTLSTGIHLNPETLSLFQKNAGFSHSLDAICQSSALSVSQVLAILTELEIAGLVHSKDGNMFHFSASE